MIFLTHKAAGRGRGRPYTIVTGGERRIREARLAAQFSTSCENRFEQARKDAQKEKIGLLARSFVLMLSLCSRIRTGRGSGKREFPCGGKQGDSPLKTERLSKRNE